VQVEESSNVFTGYRQSTAEVTTQGGAGVNAQRTTLDGRKESEVTTTTNNKKYTKRKE
jgi:hypothetical protein